MSILIKGMEMPEFGEKIIILTSSGYVEDVSGQVIAGVEAVPVPPHGRLIDADALLTHKGDCYDAQGHLLYAVGTGNIMCAPTVIPADEGE